MLDQISTHGVGIGHRRALDKQIFDHQSDIDCIEIVAEHYIRDPNALIKLKELAEAFKLVLHGVNLSIASAAINTDYLRVIKKICEIGRCEYYTEHLALTKVPGMASSHLAPAWLSQEMLKTVIKNIKKVQDYIERPLVLENISYDFVIGVSPISTEDFFCEIVNETGCGILLDVTNLHTNSYNHNFDPFRFIDCLPVAAIFQAHIAGGFYTPNGKLIDSHSHGVESKSFELLDYVTQRANLKCVILERDSNYPDEFSSLLTQMNKARAIVFGKKNNETDRATFDTA